MIVDVQKRFRMCLLEVETVNDARVFGNNCRLQMQKQAISEKCFAEKLGFSDLDVKKILDGRLALFKDDIRDIAALFHLTEKEMFEDLGTDAYNGVGYMHCMGEFINPENRDLILDILDQYCTLKECAE